MADSITKNAKPDSPVSPIHDSDGRPESPTTAQPLDFDDDQDGVAPTPTKATALESLSRPAPPPKDENPPPKPPRPIDPRIQAEQTLREAFPSIEKGVIKAVLTASGGQLEPAFNALLEMSDPEAAQREPPPPAMPPRPPRQPTSTQQSQLEADEMYARQLAEHYSGTAGQQRGPDRYNQNLPASRVGRPGASPDPDDYHWRSFIDDDLPEIRDNIKKGFLDTQKTVNSWIASFKKQIDGEGDEDFSQQPPRPAQNVGRQSNEYGRRSADYARYDADPQVIGDDFSKLEMKDGDHPPRTSSRPAANPNLFKSNAEGRKSPASGRKVSFQDGPPEEIRDMYSASPKPTTVQPPQSTGKTSKWQPLSAVEPSPVGENDPFSLGDSDDEKDAKPITLKDVEAEKTDASAEVAAESTSAKDPKTAGMK